MDKRRSRRARWLLFWKQDGMCFYCQQPMSLSFSRKDNIWGNAATLEHLLRRADCGGNKIRNFALACRDCNNRRGAVDWRTYVALRSDNRMM